MISATPEPEADVDARGRPAADRRADHADDVRAGTAGALRAGRAREAEGVPTGKDVAEAGKPTDSTRAAVELDVEQLQGQQLRPLGRAVDPACDEGQHGGLRVARSERRGGERHPCDDGALRDRDRRCSTECGASGREAPTLARPRRARPGAAGGTAALTDSRPPPRRPAAGPPARCPFVPWRPSSAAPRRSRTTSRLLRHVPERDRPPHRPTGADERAERRRPADRRRAPRPTRPRGRRAPCRAPLTPRRAVRDQRAAERAGVEVGPCVREERSCAGDDGGRRARAADRPVARRAALAPARAPT